MPKLYGSVVMQWLDVRQPNEGSGMDSWLTDFLKLGPYRAKLGAFVCVVFGLVNFTCMFA